MEINEDFKEFITLLNARKVKYLVIGGYAVNLHGYPRYTKDIDIWIKPSKENIENLLVAISDFGFGSLGLDKKDFTDPENIIQLGRAPRRIDLLTDVEELNFEDCLAARDIVKITDIAINFLNIDDLIEAKQGSGRSQDLADAEKLQEIKEID